MDPESSVIDRKDSSEKPGKDSSEKPGKDSSEEPSLPSPPAAAAKDFLKTPSVAGKDGGVSLKVPITPALTREVDASRADPVASPETPGLKVESGGEDSGDGCSTPKRGIFNSFGFESDEDDGDGCRTPRASVFDAFAPCKICPPTPGPVIPQRIRLF